MRSGMTFLHMTPVQRDNEIAINHKENLLLFAASDRRQIRVNDAFMQKSPK